MSRRISLVAVLYLAVSAARPAFQPIPLAPGSDRR